MNTIILQIGIFNILLVMLIYWQIQDVRKVYLDCRMFSRLLLGTASILVVDTIGWIIDGAPLFDQVWITTVIDGLDLILTTTVCWCWVQYSRSIIETFTNQKRKWYKDISSLLLLLQILLVSSSQILDFYYDVDASGVYHRSNLYFIHTIISMVLLCYSAILCFVAYNKSSNDESRKEFLFVSLITLLPIAGNIFQLFVYGYPTVWLCMVLMIASVYIHIQNRRVYDERKQQTHELEAALTLAQDASKAKSNFLSNMSHELRTPMNAIIGMTKLAEDEVKDNPTALNYINEIDASSEYLLGVLNDILEMNRIESGKFELNPKWTPGLEVFKNCIEMIEPSMRSKGIEFEYPQINMNDSKHHFDLYVDDLRLKEVLMNLLNNAWKFTSSGGHVSLTMHNESREDGYNIDSIIISDTGCGMSSEFVTHLFDPFAQERNQYSSAIKGTGLGLAIADKYVKAMGGTISVQSELGKGSIFKVTLPLKYRPTQLEVPQSKIVSDVNMLSGLHILLAEDHPLNATITTKLLDKKGITTDVASNGAIALRMFTDSDLNYYDVILMDIRMPEMDGLEACRRIRALERTDASTIPIIAMTANAFSEDKQECLKAGMNAHLSKPTNPNQLYETIIESIR